MIPRSLTEPTRRSLDGIVGKVAPSVLLARPIPVWLRRQAAKAFLRSQRAKQIGVANLSIERLLDVADDDVQCALLADDPGAGPSELLDLASGHEDLGLAVLARLREIDATALGESLFRAIVLDQAGGLVRLNTALTAAALNASRIAPQHARSIFERCIAILARPLDPYDPNAARASGAARQAGAAILAGDSELDELVIGALAEETRRPQLQMLAASALQERPEHAAERFVLYLGALDLTSEQAIRFAEDCDADRGTLRAVVRPRPGRVRRGLSGLRKLSTLWIRILVSLAAPLVAGVVLAVLAKGASKTLASVSIDPSVAIGAIAVLVAVQVLSVQLAAQRLPGPLAALTIATPLTLSAYVTGLLLLVSSIVGLEHPQPSWKPSLVASGLLVILVMLVAANTMLTLRATSAAAASETAGRTRVGQARRTGRRAGRLHRSAGEMQRVIDAHPSLRRFTSAQEAAHRYRVEAPSTGYLHVDSRRLREVAQLPQLVNGDLRLDLLVAPGVAVTAGQEIASLVPAGDTSLDETALVAAELPFMIHGERKLERFAELCAALCAQLPLLVGAGDPGGARRTLHALIQLLRTHLERDRRARGDTKGPLPFSPAVTQVIDRALADLEHAPGRQREMVAQLLCEVLNLAHKNDEGLIAAIAGRLGGQATTITDFGVLYAAGTRAILIESRPTLTLVQHGFHRLTAAVSDEARYANEAEGRLVTFCAAVAPRQSRAAWREWWGAAGHTPERDRTWIAIRIGAAALPVANLSLGVEIAIALAGQDFEALERDVRDHGRSAFENFLSESYGRLLGTDAEQRMIDFIVFARHVTSNLRSEPPGQ